MSCDILLRKRVFARLAASAFFKAVSSLSFSFCVSSAASLAEASAFLAFLKSTRTTTIMLNVNNPEVTNTAGRLSFIKSENVTLSAVLS